MKRKYLAFTILLLLISFNVTGSNIQDIRKVTTISFKSETLYVGGSGPNNYTKIQDAINAANHGDTVFVYSGIYYENVIVDKSISIVGENKESTIIDGDGGGDVFQVSFNYVNISCFTIINSGSVYPDSGIRSISDFNCFFNNNISSNSLGIYLYYSSNNTITDNCVNSNTNLGIRLDYSSDNKIINNNVSNNYHGIYLVDASNYNIISGNNVSNPHIGISTYYSINNKITNNNVSNNFAGIRAFSSNNTTVAENIVNSNDECGIRVSHNCNNTIIINNTLNSNDDFDIVLEGSDSNTVMGNIVSNSYIGIVLAVTNNNTITKNIIRSNTNCGIHFYSSCYNTIKGNIISNNYVDGIYVYSSSNNNKIYHNNILNNVRNAYDECNNAWDDGYPSGGNYWDDYTGEDLDGDGIGDTPYPIPGGDNEDRYPYMKYNGWLPSDLHCGGTITWTDVEPGELVYGNFMVANLGLSDLIWKIAEWPEWGVWNFGDNQYYLQPGDSWIVYFRLSAPEEPNSEFSGEIKMINIYNESDYCTVDVSLATPLSQVQSYLQIPQLINRILERFPNSFPILRTLLNL